jgi:Uma2 family endonuclease
VLPDYEQKLFTAADLAALPSELPSGLVRYELDHGRLLTMTPPGFFHGVHEGNVIAALKYLGQYQGHGIAGSGEVGVILKRNPDHIVGVDALFVGNSRLPVTCSSEGYLETIPHLVAEVRSKNDTLAAMERRAEELLQAGVVVVWVVDPINRNVVEHRQGTAPRTYTEDDTLTVEDIIPGFALPVRQALQD